MKRLGILAVLILAGNAHAMLVTVGCPGGTPGTYPSIGAAITALSSQPQNQHQIVVSGTCTENIQVHNFSDLQITGKPSATILDAGGGTPSSTPAIVFSVRSRLTLENLTIGITGSAAPFVPVMIAGTAMSNVTIVRCTLQGGAFPGGLWVNRGASATLRSTVIQDNANAGVRVDAGGDLVISEVFPGDPPTIIQRHNGNGVIVSDGATVTFRDGGNVIQNNGSGISSAGGHVFLCCDSGSKIVNNRVGIRANGGTVRVNSEFDISDNAIAGVLLTGANGALTAGSYSNNGMAGEVSSGGVVAEGSSHVDLFNASVSNNRGSGLVLRESSSARVFNNEIESNGGSGIRLTAMSTATLFGANTATGNGSYDLFCTPNSYGSGDDSGIKKKFCPGFDQSPAPKGGTEP